MNSRRKDKLADWALDIAKYISTAVLIARWFNRQSEWFWYDYIIPFMVVVLTIAFGIYLTDGDKDNSNS